MTRSVAAAPIEIEAEHARLVAQLETAGPLIAPSGESYDSYTGSGRPFYRASVPLRRAMARAWLSSHRGASPSEVLGLVDRLFRGLSHEEKTLAALLLGYSAPARRAATPAKVEVWLSELDGWAEVDSLCASVFSAAEMAADWTAWRALVQRLAADPDIDKRRAALVLLTTPTRTSDDPRFAELAFAVTDTLKGERGILITKAVSWLLRSIALRKPAEVSAYLEANADALPSIALRETRTKLATGTKSGRRAPRAAR